MGRTGNCRRRRSGCDGDWLEPEKTATVSMILSVSAQFLQRDALQSELELADTMVGVGVVVGRVGVPWTRLRESGRASKTRQNGKGWAGLGWMGW